MAPLLSDEHFSVDGTLIQAWASMKSFQPKAAAGAEPPASGDASPGQDGGASATEPAAGDGEAPAMAVHRPTNRQPVAAKPQPGWQCASHRTPSGGPQRRGGFPWPEALERDPCLAHRSRGPPVSQGPGKEAKLCFMGHALMENRNGLVVDACLTEADGHAEREAALAMIEPRADRPGRITLGADKGYDAEDFVNELRSMNVTPHVAAKVTGSAVDGRTTRHEGYAVSQRIRKRIEEVFGWGKTVGPLARTMLRGTERVGAQFTFAVAGYNLARLPKLLAA